MIVKKLLIIVFFLSINNCILSQKLHPCSYDSESWGVRMSFVDSTKFSSTRPIGSHTRMYYQGVYATRGDTLILRYTSTPDPGYCNVKSERNLYESAAKAFKTVVNFTLYYHWLNKDGAIDRQEYLSEYNSPVVLEESIVDVYNSSFERSLSLKFKGNEGTLLLGKEQTKISFYSKFRDYPVSVELSDFSGKEVFLECNIYHKKYVFNKEEKEEKYLLRDVQKNQFTLIPLDYSKNEHGHFQRIRP